MNLNSFTVGKRAYAKLRTAGGAAPFFLQLELTNSIAGDTLTLDDFRVYPIPARSSAKVAILGDRAGGFNATWGANVDSAILAAVSETLNVVSTGDLGDSTTSFATANDALKTAILARGGRLSPGMGNHDYDGTLETQWGAYFGTIGYNAGKSYYAAALGEMAFLITDDWNTAEQPDNGGGYTATAAAVQCSLLGQHLLRKLAESSARWPIFIIHHAAYSSSAAGTGWAAGRWDWTGLGVPLVLQAHVHGIERLYKDGITFLTTAMGGGNHHGWGTIDAGTKFRVEDQNTSGFLKIYDGPSELVLEYYDTALNLLDRTKIVRVEA